MAISAMSLLAFVITLCSETDAFVARTFAVRPAAQLAFLVFGPMLDLKLFFMYTRVFRPRLMWTIIACVAVQVFVYCLVVHVLWETLAPRYWNMTFWEAVQAFWQDAMRLFSLAQPAWLTISAPLSGRFGL
jgi:hypothetical protein